MGRSQAFDVVPAPCPCSVLPKEENMLRGTLAVLFAFSSLAGAQALTLAEVKAKNAAQLSADELKQLMPGAKVVNRNNAAATRDWENKADGTLAASSDGRGHVGGHATPVSGTVPGAWPMMASTA